MNLADLFLQELAKDAGVSPHVRKIGEMLAEKHKEALDTTAEFAKRQCEMFRKLEDAGLIISNPSPHAAAAPTGMFTTMVVKG